MANLAQLWVVALDGGTTNTRARLLRNEQVVATARRAVGARDAVMGGRAQKLAEAVRECLDEVCRTEDAARPERIVAAGMLTADVGLVAVPHVIAPAGLDELARGVVACSFPEIADQPIEFVPGIRTPSGPGPDGWAEADVMRGEECETLGAWQALAASNEGDRSTNQTRVFLWPGSHTKLVEVNAAGRIVRSYTTLAGELTSALARHTLLAASLPDPWPGQLDRDSLAAGGKLASREGLGRAAFLVRIADLFHSLGPAERAAFWIGAVVANDVTHLVRHPMLAHGVPVWVGGPQPQRSIYAEELAAQRVGQVRAISDELAEHASAWGALAISRRRAVLETAQAERR